MRIMPPRAIVFLLESSLFPTALGVMVLSSWRFLPRGRVVIQTTIFLTTHPAPCSSTARANMKMILKIHSTRKNIVARPILQTPALAPGALLGVLGASLHSKGT